MENAECRMEIISFTRCVKQTILPSRYACHPSLHKEGIKLQCECPACSRGVLGGCNPTQAVLGVRGNRNPRDFWYFWSQKYISPSVRRNKMQNAEWRVESCDVFSTQDFCEAKISRNFPLSIVHYQCFSDLCNVYKNQYPTLYILDEFVLGRQKSGFFA